MELWYTLGYIDIPWLQRHRLVYMGFVHCGGTFQTPTHYGTNEFVLQEGYSKLSQFKGFMSYCEMYKQYF